MTKKDGFILGETLIASIPNLVKSEDFTPNNFDADSLIFMCTDSETGKTYPSRQRYKSKETNTLTEELKEELCKVLILKLIERIDERPEYYEFSEKAPTFAEGIKKLIGENVSEFHYETKFELINWKHQNSDSYIKMVGPIL